MWVASALLVPAILGTLAWAQGSAADPSTDEANLSDLAAET